MATTILYITFDANKPARTLIERGLDFEDARIVFEGVTVEFGDRRRDYGEPRAICYGLLSGRMVVIRYTTRRNSRRLVSMRKANERQENPPCAIP